MEQTVIRKLNHDCSISTYSLEEYMNIVKEFHGSVAPGLLIGGFMMNLALKNLPTGGFFDSICETRTCLPDVIQLLTPCTIGNGWLKVMDFSRFAICLYDKNTGNGVRVFLDPPKIEAWSEIKNWFFKLKTKKEQSYDLLIDQIKQAGEGLFSVQKIKISPALLEHKSHGSKIAVCTSCGEAYKIKNGPLCPACRDGAPYAEQGEPS